MEEKKQAAKKNKNKPGRPRKTPARLPKVKHGIVKQPSNDAHYMEFIYDNPPLFKKLWSFFKSMDVKNIQMNFNSDHIIIWCQDHHNSTFVRAKIDCQDINHYFCQEAFEIGLLDEHLVLIMNTIDKTCNSITFVSTQNNVQKNIQLVLDNDEHFRHAHKVDLVGDYNRVEDETKFLDDNYCIKFKLKGKFFKKMISDIKSFSDIVTIKQDSVEDKLTFEYMTSEKKVKSANTVENNDSISLISNLIGDDTFRSTFKVDNIKAISSAVLADSIDIYVDEKKSLMFIAKLDNAIEMRILTKDIDNRHSEI